MEGEEPSPPAENPPPNGADKKVDRLLFVGPFSSYHSGGIVNFGFGDGSVRALGSIDPKVYTQLGSRADGQLLESDEF